MREPVHVVHEDYDQYIKRKRKNDFYLLILLVVAALVIFTVIGINHAIKNYEYMKLVEQSPYKCPMSRQELINYMGREPDNIDKYGFLNYNQPDNYILRFGVSAEGVLFNVFRIPASEINHQVIAQYEIFECTKTHDGSYVVTQPYIPY